MELTSFELRVLGGLMEKEMTTPENYPLTLNSLLAACNQRSSREPVMELTEDEVRQALHGLEDRGWTTVVREGRVARYEHKVRTVLQLRRDETAMLCLLLLRGPQTAGELRGRAERMHNFDDLQAVTATLERMARRPDGGPGEVGPLTVLLPRQAGSREARYMHLLGGAVESMSLAGAGTQRTEGRGSSGGGAAEELAGLRDEVQRLHEEMQRLKAEVERLRELCEGSAGEGLRA